MVAIRCFKKYEEKHHEKDNRIFNNTVFPDPLCPIIKLVLPLSKVVEIFLRILLPSKDFIMFLTSIISSVIIV